MSCSSCGSHQPGPGPHCARCGKPLAPGDTAAVSTSGPGGADRPSLADGGNEPTHVTVRPGDVLEGKWRLERKLGEGGMGTVYLAHELALDRKVAIKLLAPALAHDMELVSRFEREAKLTAGLEHPNVVPVFAVGRLENRPFMVMKALEGKTLGLWLRERGTLRKEEVIPLFRQLAAGLDFIHQRGFIHRDIKAGNNYVSSNGHATLLDFGIIRPSRNAEQLTRTGMVMGTPQYMSPEQAMGIRDIDHRSDLYALATLLFECLAGSLPFESDNDLSTIQMQAHTPPPNLSERAPWVPQPVADVLTRALAKNPDHRYPTANALVDALQAAYGEAPGSSAPGSTLSSGPLSLSSFPLPPPPGAPGSPGSTPNPAPVRAEPPPARPTTAERSAAHQASAAASASAGPSTAELTRGLRSRRLPFAVAGALVLVLGAAAIIWSIRPAAPAEVGTGEPPLAADAGGVASAAAGLPDAAVAAAVPLEVPDGGEDESGDDDATTPAPIAEDGQTADGGAAAPEGTAQVPGTHRHPATRTKGKLNVISTHRGEPYWAKLSIDGEKRGTTPVLLELAAGKHQLRLERVGFKPVVKQIKIAPGRVAVVRIELLP